MLRIPPPILKPLTWFFHPIRLSGILALTFLAGPGSLLGFSMLKMHIGAPPVLTPVSPQIHALLQILGFFLLLIWGFLVHGLPGMMGANAMRTKWIRIPMLVTATGLWLVYGTAAVTGTAAWHDAAWITLFAGTLSGSWVLIAAALRTGRRWFERPLPMLILPLAVPPLGVLASWLRPEWLHRSGAEIVLTLGLVPILLAMGYRMFSAMLGLKLPKDHWFDTGAVVWMIGWGLKILVSLSPSATLAADGCVFLATLALVVGMRVAESPRDNTGGNTLVPMDRSLLLYVRISFVFLVLSGLLPLVASRYDLGSQFYAADLARHDLAIGFCLVLVAGITQKVFPIFLRGKPSSPAWMNGNLFLLVIGMALRSTELFLPATTRWVDAAGVLLVTGIASYALHIVRGLIVPNKKYAKAAPDPV